MQAGRDAEMQRDGARLAGRNRHLLGKQILDGVTLEDGAVSAKTLAAGQQGGQADGYGRGNAGCFFQY